VVKIRVRVCKKKRAPMVIESIDDKGILLHDVIVYALEHVCVECSFHYNCEEEAEMNALVRETKVESH